MKEQDKLPLSVTTPVTHDGEIPLVLEPLLQKVKPPLSDSEIRNVLTDIQRLETYVRRKGQLPNGFELIKDQFEDPAHPTHISRLNRWGWIGKHNLMFAVYFDPNEITQLQVAMILRAKKVSFNTRELGSHKKDYRAKIVSQKGETPRFHLH